MDQRGQNRIWPAIGYTPSSQPAPGAETLRVVTFDTSTTIDCDVCVIGSGAGGGTVAGELTAKGIRTVVLEAGPGDQAPQFTQRELDGTQKLFYQSGLSASSDLSVAIFAGACLGGGTTVNWQTSLRTPDYIRDEWAERSGCELFTSERFTKALDAVCQRIGVSSDESDVNANNEPIRRGCDALGYGWEVIERNSRGCDCSQCGYCTFGCRVGGKQSTVATYLHVMQRWRASTIVARCRAERILIERGKVVGVAATTRAPDGVLENIEINAPIVVVCGGGLETPALLERSGLSHSQLGRNLYLHPTSAVAGVHAGPIESWQGPPQTILSGHFSRLDGNFGFRLEAAPVHPGLLALAAPWTDARSHRRLMQRSANVSATIALTRDASGGRVRAGRGGGVTIDYTLGRREQSLVSRGIAAAVQEHHRVAAGAGADEGVLVGHVRRAVVRASRAEERRPHDERGGLARGEPLEPLEPRSAAPRAEPRDERGATTCGSSSPYAGRRGAPSGSRLPTTRGAPGSRRGVAHLRLEEAASPRRRGSRRGPRRRPGGRRRRRARPRRA